jgi:hypothetical protein
MASNFKIGTTAGGITSLDALGTPCPDPQWEFQQYRKMDKLADGSMRGRGPNTIVWSFPMLEDDQIAVLAGFISTSSVFIQSKKRDGTTAIYETTMNWTDPRQDGDHMQGFVGYRSGLTIEFLVWAVVTP